MSTSKLLTAGLTIGALFTLACQSADDKQAGELRQLLRDQVAELEIVNTQLIEDYKAFLKERIASGREILVIGVRRTLEEMQQTLPAELATLRQWIEEYPTLELSALSQEIKGALERGRMRVEDVARERHDARRADELGEHWKGVGRSMHESIRREAQEGPAWLRTKPQQSKDQ